jgi:hypothetical protein
MEKSMQECVAAWGDKVVGVRRAKCSNGYNHNVAIVKYEDSSLWVCCSNFGYFDSKIGCKSTGRRCRFFKSA